MRKVRVVFFLPLVVLVLWGLCGCVSQPFVDARVSFVQSREPRDIVLIYCGFDARGARNWDQEKFNYYLAYWGEEKESLRSRSAAKKQATDFLEQELAPDDVLFDTFLFMYRKSSRGHLFETSLSAIPTDKEDWEECLRRFFDAQQQLAALDGASEKIARALGLEFKPKVILTLPYPDVRQKDFGSLPGSSESLDFTRSEEARLAALRWYVDEAIRRWQAANFKNLILIGFYWFNEGHLNLRGRLGLTEEDAPLNDFELMKAACQYIHGKKVEGQPLTMSWIPYNPYGNERLDFCKQWLSAEEGQQVDYLMIQPNYFFPRWNKSVEDLRRVIDNARAIGAGIEIEFDEKLVKDVTLQQRLLDYLEEARKTGSYYHNTYFGYYQGVNAFYQVATTASTRAVYEELCGFIRNRRRP